ncbi:Uncharacterized protein dnm_078200 [Desulfonema magnum]|uniref:Uncharacterized protein n=1 Tax=Desulfonema magnum TaxID=45655 RepID=A0A975BU19_9BACT|nr:Uncharacterized protein dnm_078200 [Desulfonema magnum]
MLARSGSGRFPKCSPGIDKFRAFPADLSIPRERFRAFPKCSPGAVQGVSRNACVIIPAVGS